MSDETPETPQPPEAAPAFFGFRIENAPSLLTVPGQPTPMFLRLVLNKSAAVQLAQQLVGFVAAMPDGDGTQLMGMVIPGVVVEEERRPSRPARPLLMPGGRPQ